MRSIWRGAVSFGLVSIGVKLYSATEDKDVRFHQVHAADGGRVKYKRVCSIDGEEIEYGDIAKGYELPDGQLVILTDDDLAEMPLSTRREIEVLQFVDQAEIDPVHFEKTYYLEPDGPATRPYVLLRDALGNTGRVAITKIALRQRESLAALRVKDGVMVLHTMRWPDEIRRPDFAFPAAAAPRRAPGRPPAGGAPRARARRDPPSGLRLPRRGRRRPAAGAADGRGADRVDDRGVRPHRVHRRLPRGDGRAARGQAERRRGAAAAGDRRVRRGGRGPDEGGAPRGGGGAARGA